MKLLFEHRTKRVLRPTFNVHIYAAEKASNDFDSKTRRLLFQRISIVINIRIRIGEDIGDSVKTPGIVVIFKISRFTHFAENVFLQFAPIVSSRFFNLLIQLC